MIVSGCISSYPRDCNSCTIPFLLLYLGSICCTLYWIGNSVPHPSQMASFILSSIESHPHAQGWDVDPVCVPSVVHLYSPQRGQCTGLSAGISLGSRDALPESPPQSSSERVIVGSHILLYDKERKVAMLLHFAGFTDVFLFIDDIPASLAGSEKWSCTCCFCCYHSSIVP